MSGQPNRDQEDETKLSELKALILERAKRGVFNRNPLLSTAHLVTCPNCRHRQSVVYLNSLKAGEFDFGKAEQVEVHTLQGPIGFLERESVTPVLIRLSCEKCGFRIEVAPVSVEYLRYILTKPQTSGTMYV